MRLAKPKIGLALGSGSARGWSHIGIIRVLEKAGIVPDIVCGTSIGSLVGAAYADGQLASLEAWVRGLSWQSIVGLLDFTTHGGLIHGEKLFAFLRSHFHDRDFASLSKAFGAVTTELATGREVWLRDGPVIDAVRASAALPGLFKPAEVDGRLMVDGALVNPVPVSLCRAMGADIVIAVDLNSDLIGRHFDQDGASPEAGMSVSSTLTAMLDKLPLGFSWLKGESETPTTMPSIFDVLSTSLNIMQVRITRSRLAGEPADVLIRPRLANFALMDYHRADQAIAEGERAAQRALSELYEVLGRA